MGKIDVLKEDMSISKKLETSGPLRTDVPKG
jgi:hypothetical protein